MSDDFSDLKDAEQRELCLGFVDQLKSGKPATVIKMIMKSRGLTDAQQNRVIKAAGGAAAPAPAKSIASELKKEKKEDKKKEKKEKSSSSSSSTSSAAAVPVAPPMAPPMAPPLAAAPSPASSASPPVGGEKVKEKKKKSKKEKADKAGGEDSSDEDKSQALVVVESEKERKKKKKKEKEKEETAAAASGPRQDRLTSIESLESSKQLKPIKSTTNSEAFAQKHLGAAAAPQPTTSTAPGRRASQIKLKAYDDPQSESAEEQMYGGVGERKAKKDGCVIC